MRISRERADLAAIAKNVAQSECKQFGISHELYGLYLASGEMDGVVAVGVGMRSETTGSAAPPEMQRRYTAMLQGS